MKLLTKLGKIVLTIIQFGWFSIKTWLVVFAEIILWNALPDLLWLRLLSCIGVCGFYWCTLTGFPSLKKSEGKN